MKYLIIITSFLTITNAFRKDGGKALAMIYMTGEQVIPSKLKNFEHGRGDIPQLIKIHEHKVHTIF